MYAIPIKHGKTMLSTGQAQKNLLEKVRRVEGRLLERKTHGFLGGEGRRRIQKVSVKEAGWKCAPGEGITGGNAIKKKRKANSLPLAGLKRISKD